MTNPSTETKIPNGLLQSTEFTDKVTVTIQRVTDAGNETVISFTNNPIINDFFAIRGAGLGVDQPTNVISLRVLALDLLKIAQSQQQLGLDTAAQVAEHARKLHAAVNDLSKNDQLVCSFGLADDALTM